MQIIRKETDYISPMVDVIEFVEESVLCASPDVQVSNPFSSNEGEEEW